MNGGFVGVVSWTFTYPIDSIKTRIQINYNTNFLKEFKILNQ